MPDLSRRNLFKGKLGASKKALRPPWAVEENLFTELCTRCGECVTNCPESLIVISTGGFPEVDFSRGECTFCGECEAICADNALSKKAVIEQGLDPWTYKAKVNATCLTLENIVCRTCYEFCEPGAFRFMPVLGGVSQPQLDTEKCTGCGACVATCPANAIEIEAL